VVALVGCVLLAACTSAPVTVESVEKPRTPSVKTVLYQQYSQWRGVPYRMGGTTPSGVDCSALVQITYRDLFALELPRSTSELASVGDQVSHGEERSGDLVFFKTGFWQRHVGIYLENGRFMHASASNGVMISSLDEPYWRERYWVSRRPASRLLASR